jgi:hypothetical protein
LPAFLCGQAVDLLGVEDRVGFEEGNLPIDRIARGIGLGFLEAAGEPVSPFRTAPPSSIACLNVIQIGETKPRAAASAQSRSTFIPLYGKPLCRSGRVTPPLPLPERHGCIQGRTPFSRSATILSVIRA